jgi:hypothetical protein
MVGKNDDPHSPKSWKTIDICLIYNDTEYEITMIPESDQSQNTSRNYKSEKQMD